MNSSLRMLAGLLMIGLSVIETVSGHGYLMEPPQRSTAWSFGYDIPPNYNHMGLNCGGAGNQWSAAVDGRCGACGDPYNAADKPNEDIGGRYVTGIVTGSYVSGSHLDARVKITAYHKGWFEFRLCPLPNSHTKVTQACLNQTLLAEVGTGNTRFLLEPLRQTLTGSETYDFILQLPNYACDNCVLQWWYNTGNSWGCDSSGCGIGKGKQETFVNCADIELVGGGAPPTQSSSQSNPQNNPQSSPQSSSTTTTTTTTTTPAPTPEPTKRTTTTPQPITTRRTNTGGGCTCVGVAPYDAIIGIDQWCCMNCERGYCPASHCRC